MTVVDVSALNLFRCVTGSEVADLEKIRFVYNSSNPHSLSV